MITPDVVHSEVVLKSYPFNVVQERLAYPDGRVRERSVVRHPGAVALVAIDAEGRWLLVRQYRHAAGRWLLEVPAGTLEVGEAPETTAARELREETGFAADQLERLGGTWMAPGFCSEFIHFFLATGLRPAPLPQDEDEDLSDPVALTLDEVWAAIESGEIEDAKTVVAAALFQRHAGGASQA
jgi:ADP-ribose pyrophosphatase